MVRLTIQVSPAEVIDRYLILKLKTARFLDPAKRERARQDMEEMKFLRNTVVHDSEALETLEDRLWKCHLAIWDAEERARQCIGHRTYGMPFAVEALHIIQNNDERAAVKRQIDLLLGAVPGEEKEYGR